MFSKSRRLFLISRMYVFDAQKFQNLIFKKNDPVSKNVGEKAAVFILTSLPSKSIVFCMVQSQSTFFLTQNLFFIRRYVADYGIKNFSVFFYIPNFFFPYILCNSLDHKDTPRIFFFINSYVSIMVGFFSPLSCIIFFLGNIFSFKIFMIIVYRVIDGLVDIRKDKLISFFYYIIQF